MLSHFSRVRIFVTHGTVAHQVLCLGHSPGRNTGAGYHALLQGIFPTQQTNPHILQLLLYRRILYC